MGHERLSFIDTHAHLDDARYDRDREEVIARARDAGLKALIIVACWKRENGFAPALELARRHDFIYAAMGVHPHEARDVRGEAPFGLIRDTILGPGNNGKKVVAIGETGLDYYYMHSPREVQARVFERHIHLARELNLPLIVHSRDAGADTMAMLREQGAGDIGGVFHCFSGDRDMARAVLDMGFHVSFAGQVTFDKAAALVDTARFVPIERMLVETDAPYLSPAPERGKRNEPAFIVNTIRKIAAIKGLSDSDVARITTLNAEGLFAMGARPAEAKIAYKIRDSLYLNITNRCTNLCTFCAKFKSYTVKGHYLRLGEEPSAQDVLRAIGPDPAGYDEVVFCGYGEPLLRMDLVKEVGLSLKKAGCRIRIDTDGLANLANERNVLPELAFVDCISVSLNAPDSETYQRIVKTPFGQRAFPAILDFLKEARRHIPKVVATAVSVPGVDMEATRKVAEDELGVVFRKREYNEVG